MVKRTRKANASSRSIKQGRNPKPPVHTVRRTPLLGEMAQMARRAIRNMHDQIDEVNAIVARIFPAFDSAPLTDTEQAVFELIEREGPISGKHICAKLSIELPTLTSRIIPVLKRRRGVANRRGAGYYVK